MRTSKIMSLTVFVTAVMLLSAGLALAGPSQGAGGNGAVQGSSVDGNAPALGEVTYLFNKAGYHFWFTVSADLGPDTEGHSYHNIYKYDVGNPSEWCPTTTVVPDRLPYNAGDTVGETVYYKIWDVTAETWVCGSD